MNYESFIDFEVFCANYLKILTKKNGLQPLLLNKYQQALWNLICELRAQNKPVRIIILKARQMGISTFCAAYLYWLTTTNRYTNSRIIAHDKDSTDNIFNIFKRYYDLTPLEDQPMKRRSNAKELVFENPSELGRQTEPGLMSQLSIQTAGSRDTAGRSSMIHHLHISEHAFWPEAELSTPALLSAVSEGPESTVFIESTANGMIEAGKDFYERVQKAQKNLSEFSFFFIPWTDDIEYVKPYTGFELNDTERKLKDLHHLSLEQISWRRWKIENTFNGDEILFRQENPLTPEEAFIVSGTPYFDSELLFALIKNLENKTYQKGYIKDSQFIEDRNGFLTLYAKPKPGELYVLGVDVSEGLQHGDSSSIVVLDRDLNQVASYYAKIDPDLLGDECIAIGSYYNQALICVEVNNMGQTTVDRLKLKKYFRVFMREVYDEVSDKRTKKIGWRTTQESKLTMLADFKARVRNGEMKINDIELLREMLTVSFETASKVELNGKDRVVSACLAVQALAQLPQKTLYKAHNPEKTKIKEMSALEFLTKDKKDAYFTYYD